MTLSNFNWTDKDSTRWFILLPTGHEGPFSLTTLLELSHKKHFAHTTKVWAEGLPGPIELTEVLERSQSAILNDEESFLSVEVEDELPPPIDRLLEENTRPKNRKTRILFGGLLSLSLLLFVFYFIKTQEHFRLYRLPKMSLDLYERIIRENSFGGWSRDLFFKEYISADHSLIWLVTASYQSCKIEAKFASIKDRLLTMDDEKIVFQSSGVLKNHLVELSSFDFESGSRIIPGLYEMDLKATECVWNGFLPRLINRFAHPTLDYVARMKVILFSKGSFEFNRNLENLLSKKKELEERRKGQQILFWQDLEQKFHTLEAVTLQIEQHFLDFLETERPFKRELNHMIETYAKMFGSFLSSFVLENEKLFKSYHSISASKKRNYELLIRLISKKIGLESMKLIEEFQTMKRNPVTKQRKSAARKVRQVFQKIKTEINEKLSEVEKDQLYQP